MKIAVLNLVTPIRFGGNVAQHQITASPELDLEFDPDEEVIEFRKVVAGKSTVVLIVPRDNVASMVPQS